MKGKRAKSRPKPKAKPKPKVVPAPLTIPEPPMVPGPSQNPGLARHRVLRCERCRTYLFDVFLKRCDPGTKASLIVTMKCRNKRCRRTNQVSVDLINEDEKRIRV